MRNRIFIVIICLSLATWISYVSYDLIRVDTSTNLRDCFSFEDELIVVAHNPKEINWEENNLEVLSISLAIYNSIVPKINYESSIFLSSKRPVILIERKENWIKKEVEAIFSKGLMPLKFQGKMNFTFGKYKGIFLKNQLILFQGRLIKNTHLRFDVDKKASYSLIFLSEKMIKTSDVYKKGRGILKYTKTKFSKTKINSIDDSKLFAGILPREFNTYSFFSTSFLKETDHEFKKSDFSKWVDKGLVFISNKNQNAVVFYFKEGQNPIQNINEKLNIDERNESSANFKNILFSSHLEQDTSVGFFIEEFNNFAVISTEKSYLDDIVTEINLGNSLSQDEKKMNFVYSELPIKVASRIVSNKVHKAVTIFYSSKIETEYLPSNQIDLQEQKNDKDYFTMNIGERVNDFVALDDRGNVIALTESNKLIGYINGLRKWDKQLLNSNVILKDFSSDKNYFSLLLNGECQIFDKNGRLIYRLMATNGIAPLKFSPKEEFFTVNGPKNFSLLNNKGAIIKQFSTNDVIKQIGQYEIAKKIQIGILTKNVIYFLNPLSRTVTKKIPCDSSLQLFTNNSSLFYAGITNNSLQIINEVAQSKIIKIKPNSSIIGHYFENNNLVLLIKNTNVLSAIDHNGILKWRKTMNLSEISSSSVNSSKNGIILIGILDAIENKLYLLNSSGEFIANQDLKGSEKIQITRFGENAFSISTILGNSVIQYTKF
jgi:hypothetical protein